MDTQERNKLLAERKQQAFKAPFVPDGTPERALQPDIRIANALEYSAAQLGSIARILEQIEARLKRGDDIARISAAAKDAYAQSRE